MAFSDELSWQIDAIRVPVDEVASLTDSIGWTRVSSAGTTVSALVKKGAKWRQEIYHSRRVERQDVLG